MQSNDKDPEDDWLASIEEEYLASMAAEPDYEGQYISERESSMRGMWSSFQESATSIAQLYRDRLHSNETGALWLPFQTAAGTVTTLYKESSDSLKRTNETAIHCGYQRRSRELTNWLRKKNRRYIRREELLAYLAGKPSPPLHAPKSSNNHHNYHPHGTHHSPSVAAAAANNNNNNHRHSSTLAVGVGHLGSAIGIGNSAVNGNLHHLHPHHHNHLHHHRLEDGEEAEDSSRDGLSRRPRTPDLYAFVASEMARHMKRPSSPPDINMDSPSLNKRQRFL